MFIFREMEQDETRNSDRKGIFMTISTNCQCWNRSDTCGAEEMLLLYESRLLSKCTVTFQLMKILKSGDVALNSGR